jgi:hypothetical protein
MASFLNTGWHVLTLALKQGSLGKVVLDGTTIATGINSDGIPPTTSFKLNALSGGDHQSGYAFKFAAVGAAFHGRGHHDDARGPGGLGRVEQQHLPAGFTRSAGRSPACR